MSDIEITKVTAFPRTDVSLDSPEGHGIINEAVARKMGWTIGQREVLSPVLGNVETLGRRPGKTYKDYGDYEGWDIVPDYCHSIKAAWEIVESKPRILFNGAKRFYVRSIGKTWRAGWMSCEDYEEGDTACDAEADTAPMAICLAFLKLP